MPSKKECAKKFPKGSKAYKKCIAYKDQANNQQPQQGGQTQQGGGGYGV